MEWWLNHVGQMAQSVQDYSKHPIMEFYNRELEHDYKKLEECSQLCVSINTDDKGVFSTSLENEYSLMARALEEMKKKMDHLSIVGRD